MTRIVVRSRVGADGMLHLTVPVGPEEADREVQVTIETAPAPISQEEWRAWVERSAGSITDPTFRRHEQGEFEEREQLG